MKMTKKEKALEAKFEAAVERNGYGYISLSKPYMHETEAGYDSPYTQHMFDGYVMGLEDK